MSLTPHQIQLVKALIAHPPADAREEAHKEVILAQVRATEQWWHRDTLPGHVTASAFIVSPDLSQILLHHHKKLDRWLQLGGHDEGERAPSLAVLREVREESGLSTFDFFAGPQIFDLDVHAIPTTPKMAAHDHLDVRFLITADSSQPLAMDHEESNALRWFPLDEGITLMGEVGAERVGRKIRSLRPRAL